MDQMPSNRTPHFPTYTAYTLYIGINSSLPFFVAFRALLLTPTRGGWISVFLVEQLKVSYHLVACSVNSHKRGI